jgi:hypothetical protein
MWVKRTPEEMADVAIREKRRRVRVAFAVGLFVLLVATFTHGKGKRRSQGLLVSRQEVPGRLVFSVPFCIVLGAVAYWINPGRRKPMVVCPKCEATKYADSVSVCDCGGVFEDMDTMKWT